MLICSLVDASENVCLLGMHQVVSSQNRCFLKNCHPFECFSMSPVAQCHLTFLALYIMKILGKINRKAYFKGEKL